MKYDVCVVSFSDLRYDGRSRNLIETLLSLGLRLVVFSTSEHSISGTQHFYIPLSQNRRHIIRWIAFVSAVRNELCKFEFGTYYACDLYSLPPVSVIHHKCNIVYDSREIYSELSTLYGFSIRQMVVTAIERHYIKRINKLVTSGVRDSAYIKKRYQLDIPVFEIFNYPQEQKYVQSNLIRQKFNISETKYVLIYQGVILAGRGLTPILYAIKNDKRYELIILGEGEYRTELEALIDILQINDRVHFVGNVKYAELHKWTCAADIGLCNIEPLGLSYEYALPNKLFEYIQAELPILTTDLPAIREIVDATECGVVISANNTPADILAALEKITNNMDFYRANAKIAKYSYTYKTQSKAIEQILKE